MSKILDEVFTYENNELSVIKKGDDIWFKAKTIAEILEYKNTKRSNSLIMLILKIKQH